jgi:pyridoxamine 5'-phosphate oxidase
MNSRGWPRDQPAGLPRQRNKALTEKDLSELRREYAARELDAATVDPDPIAQFALWFDEANESGVLEPNAMVLATAGSDGAPTQRTVLLKYFDSTGLVFFTNYGSRKARQIGENARVSLLFPWLPLQRQVEINGVAEKVSMVESLRYFARRPRESQLGAWVSRQSSVVSTRSLLLGKLDELRRKFAGGEIPLPSFWGGFRVVPSRLEFWQGGPHRLHDRIEYSRADATSPWTIQRLAP